MAYDVDAVAEAIATSLKSLASDAVGVQAVAYELSNPTGSGIYVSEGDVEYDLTMGRGLDRFEMIVRVLVGTGLDQAAQRRLRKLRDKVKPLIEVDKTLGGLVDHARVTKASRPRLYGPEGTKRPLGCELTVEIHATP